MYQQIGIDFISLDQPLPRHTSSSSSVYSGFQPFFDKEDRQVYDGQIGIEVENLTGTGTSRFTKDLGNNIQSSITILTNLAGLDLANTAHEVPLRALDISESNTQELGYSPTSTDADASGNGLITESPGDLPITKELYDMAAMVVRHNFESLYGAKTAYMFRPIEKYME